MTEDPRRDSHTRSFFGAIAEDTITIALLHSARGKTAVARPLVDLGYDAYARRVGTILVVPIQVKARRSLDVSGQYYYRIPVRSVQSDPNGAMVFGYFPPPGPEPFPKVFAIPIPYFTRHCPVYSNPDGQYFEFKSTLTMAMRKWSPFFVDLHQLQQQWLDRLPGWSGPLGRVPSLADLRAQGAVEGRDHKLRGVYGEWFVAGKVQIAGGHQVIVAQDRVRVDAVALLIHDLQTYTVGGLAIHSAPVTRKGSVQASFGATTFFGDDQLWLVVLGAYPDGSFHDAAFVIPSSDVPDLFTKTIDPSGSARYKATFYLGSRSRKSARYRVATADLGQVILEKVRGTPTQASATKV